MNAKRLVAAFSVMLFLVSLSCTPNTADEDQLYKTSVEKEKVRVSNSD